jgi:hypothetical protein
MMPKLSLPDPDPVLPDPTIPLIIVGLTVIATLVFALLGHPLTLLQIKLLLLGITVQIWYYTRRGAEG